MLKKQIKTTQIIWEIIIIESIKQIMIINHSKFYHQAIKIQEINNEKWKQLITCYTQKLILTK